MYRAHQELHSTYFLCHGNHQNARTDPNHQVMLFQLLASADECGHSCIEHTCCGEQVQLNAVLCVHMEQICTSQGEETAMCCYIVKDGIHQCHVEFLRCSFTKCDKYYGVLVQVIDVISPHDSNAIRRAKFAFMGGLMQLSLEWPNIVPHHVMSNIQESRKKYIIIHRNQFQMYN